MSEVSCPSCGAAMTEEAARTTARLLRNLDSVRTDRLATLYLGESPGVLCSTCFLTTAGVLNGIGAS
jgi:hypothetical protein